MRSPTPEQLLDRVRFKKHLQREGLSGVLNNTKWEELFQCITALSKKIPLEFQRKDVRTQAPSESYWDRDIYNVFSGSYAIEWLKIKSESVVKRGHLIGTLVENHNTDLVAALKLLGIPFEAKEEHVIFYAYLRPGSDPKWFGK